jgi:hypothetical protein
MADSNFFVLPSPYPNSANCALVTNRKDLDTSSPRRHPLYPPQCLVRAEHEILIFLYFQRRILGISKQEITFCAKDRRLRRQVIVRLTPKEFLAAWMQHVPERYKHAVRSFGMFAPRAIGNSSAAVFAILGQSRRARPRPLPWSSSIKRDFGWDPLLDRQGNRMTWNRRIAPQSH